MILIAQTVIFMIFIRPLRDVMNIIVAIIFGLKLVPECIKMHHFKGEHAKIFLGDLTPVGAFGAFAFGTRLVDPHRPHFWIRACPRHSGIVSKRLNIS